MDLATLAHCGGGLSSRGQNWCQKRLFNYVHRQLFKHDVWLQGPERLAFFRLSVRLRFSSFGYGSVTVC